MIRIRALAERFRSSLFFLPAMLVLVAAVLAWVMGRIDARMDANDVPAFLSGTVDGARALLGTIAAATITVAGVVFSVTVVSVQLASSQFSPRVLRGFFRDRFQQTVMGIVVGTFTYCLLVLRSIRGAGGDREAVVPDLSVALAVLLGVVSALAILAFIDHGAHLMQVGTLVHRVAEETLRRIREMDPPAGTTMREDMSVPADPGHPVLARRSGWVQQVDTRNLLEAAEPGGTVRLETRVGWFVIQGTAVATVWPEPSDHRRCEEEVHEAIQLGPTRTMQEDVSFGIRQMVDIALRALSPAINDPTTAYEVTVNLTAVLHELLLRDLPPTAMQDRHGRVLVRPNELTHADFVGRAFDQIRESGARQPVVAAYLLGALGRLRRTVEEAGLEDRAGPLVEQARLVFRTCEEGSPLPEDLATVRAAASKAGFGV